jgi:hypothetical protein
MKTKCTECGGSGWIAIGNNVTRCEQCRKFNNHLQAAAAFFRSYRGVFALKTISFKNLPQPAK